MKQQVYEDCKAACTAAIKARGGVGHDYEWKPVEPGTPRAFKLGEVDMVELHVDDFEDTEGRNMILAALAERASRASGPSERVQREERPESSQRARTKNAL